MLAMLLDLRRWLLCSLRSQVQPLFSTLVCVCPALAPVAARIEVNRECWVAAGHVHTTRRSLDLKR